ncbi:hypothetical protein KC19_4G134000 [Ceratodon purpureus]|uniref:Uncharacterized protein n=1 Tax=Ceratodon purpureus TaxID=3225 RepID=A0A8T0IAT6_CERPU|nr:hypothetical protein KC19_4G134000 [Ceratodon purpureus]
MASPDATVSAPPHQAQTSALVYHESSNRLHLTAHFRLSPPHALSLACELLYPPSDQLRPYPPLYNHSRHNPTRKPRPLHPEDDDKRFTRHDSYSSVCYSTSLNLPAQHTPPCQQLFLDESLSVCVHL